MACSFGRLIRRFLHYGPLTATFIIVLVAIMTIACIIASTPVTSLRLPNGRSSWQHHASWGTFLNLTVFLCFAVLTTYHFITCMVVGPGFVKHNWTPQSKSVKEKLQYCQECEAYKCPRSHHCRKCQRCVKKMDHHCPWINACVGHKNHAHFIRFLFYAAAGCFYGGVVLADTAVKIIFYTNSHFILAFYFNTITRFVMLVFACGIAFGVSLAVGFLIVMQLRDISRNTTNIEAWIIKKARWRHSVLETEFKYPYDLGSRWENLIQVVNTSNFATGDGYSWPVVDGTDQYTFTEEQRLQKAAKRQRMVQHSIITTHNWFSSLTLKNPLLLCVCNGLDENYIKVEKGEHVLVSRWRKRWLYGCVKRVSTNKDGKLIEKEVAGWIPRVCAMEGAEQPRYDKKTE